MFTSLLTGQEKREVPEATHVSCTVEMVGIDKPVDVAVIDEIQMIGNKERGFAWSASMIRELCVCVLVNDLLCFVSRRTRALLGLQAREIHVCGGLEAADIVRNLCESTGDDFELKTYARLSTLQ